MRYVKLFYSELYFIPKQGYRCNNYTHSEGCEDKSDFLSYYQVLFKYEIETFQMANCTMQAYIRTQILNNLTLYETF